ncbi:MAG: hypothetical protein ABIO02_00955, partial [Patescibacteria group bacterium]
MENIRYGHESVGQFRCIVHGSYQELNWPQVEKIRDYFKDEGLQVLAPLGKIVGYEFGYAVLEGQQGRDPNEIEGEFLESVISLASGKGFSYFVDHDLRGNTNGYIGRSALAELGAGYGKVPQYFKESPNDVPLYLPANSIYEPEKLVDYIRKNGALPKPYQRRYQKEAHNRFLNLSKSNQAVGAIMEYTPKRGESEIFLVRTHQWGGQWSIVGQRTKPYHSSVYETLFEGIVEETANKTGSNPEFLDAFGMDSSSNYYKPHFLQFTDFIVKMGSRRFRLNDEAEEGLWVPAHIALKELDIEINARRS